jgi:hypothetical protein
MACLFGSESPQSTYVRRMKSTPVVAPAHELLTPPPSTRPSLEFDPLDSIRNFYQGPRTQRLNLKVPKHMFPQAKALIDAIPGRVRYEYDWLAGKLILYGGPSSIHESVIGPVHILIYQLTGKIQDSVSTRFQVASHGSAITTLRDRDGSPTREKSPDASWKLQLGDEELSGYPQLVFEVGYSESEKELEVDARHWLYESQNCVVCM